MFVAGTDEAGRGPLAGPVVAAAVIFPEGYEHTGIKDSKQLTAKKREQLYDIIKRESLAWSIVAVGHHRIELLNIREASRLAMRLAVQRVAGRVCPGLVLVDGNVPIDVPWKQKTVIGGDAIHIPISAASILAKVWRDRLMTVFDTKYPGYGFAEHAGYGTIRHRKALHKLGPCPIHRLDFRGVYDWETAVVEEPLEEPGGAGPDRRKARQSVPA